MGGGVNAALQSKAAEAKKKKKEGKIQGFHPIFGFWVKILYSRPEP